MGYSKSRINRIYIVSTRHVTRDTTVPYARRDFETKIKPSSKLKFMAWTLRATDRFFSSFIRPSVKTKTRHQCVFRNEKIPHFRYKRFVFFDTANDR